MVPAQGVAPPKKNTESLKPLQEALEKAAQALEQTEGKTALLIKALQEKHLLAPHPPQVPVHRSLWILNEVIQFVHITENLGSMRNILVKTQEINNLARDIKSQAALLTVKVDGLKDLLQNLKNASMHRKANTEKIKELINQASSIKTEGRPPPPLPSSLGARVWAWKDKLAAIFQAWIGAKKN